jgi:hypothetical protein
MRENDEFIGQVEDYLVEFDGDTPLPGRVLDAIHAELPRTRQVHGLPGPLRMFTMLPNVSTRSGLAAAALVVAAVGLGVVLLNNNRSNGVGAPTPAASATQTPAPSPTAQALSSLEDAPREACSDVMPDCIEPGTYKLGPDWPSTISFTVPAGWYSPEPAPGLQALLVDRSPDAPALSGWGAWFLMVDTATVSRDPCDPDAGLYPAADVETAEELAAVMTNWPGFDVTTPEAITIDGMSGIRVRITSTKGADECPASVLFLTTNGAQKTEFAAYPMINDVGAAYPADFRIFEVNGTLVAIRTMGLVQTSPHEESIGIAREANRHAEDQVELASILDSIRIEPRPQP